MSETNPKHPIRVVARRTGLTPAVLRAWERRYQAVVPDRSEGGQRLYSDEDVRRLALLKEAVDGGRAISRVAELETEELEAMVREDRRAAGGGWVGTGQEGLGDGGAQGVVERAMKAVEEMAPRSLEEVLRRAAVTLPPSVLVDQVLVPVLREIGERWRGGELGPAHEHLASAVVRRFLEWLVDAAEAGVGAPVMLTATPAGQRHELGALLAAVVGALAGWSVVYLGPDLPAEEIGEAARGTGADLVVLSALTSEGPELLGEIQSLVEGLRPGMDVVVGGPGAALVSQELEALEVRYVEDFKSFRELLTRAGAL